MPENLPRTLLALTVIVAVAAMYLGYRDYFGSKAQTQTNSAAPVSSSDSNSATGNNKSAVGKTKRVRRSASRPDACSSAGLAAGGMGRALTQEQADASTANAIIVDGESLRTALPGAAYENARGIVLPQRTYDSARKTASRELRGDEVENILSHIDCVPLPNSTQPEDVDAPYYQNWAREYGCVWNPK